MPWVNEKDDFWWYFGYPDWITKATKDWLPIPVCAICSIRIFLTLNLLYYEKATMGIGSNNCPDVGM